MNRRSFLGAIAAVCAAPAAISAAISASLKREPAARLTNAREVFFPLTRDLGTVYVALHTSKPGSSCSTECGFAEYARVPIKISHANPPLFNVGELHLTCE